MFLSSAFLNIVHCTRPKQSNVSDARPVSKVVWRPSQKGDLNN